MRTGVSGSGKGLFLPVLMVAVSALLVVTPVRLEAASVNCYLKIDTVPGDVVVNGQPDWIEVQTWGFGESQMASVARSAGGGSATAGRVQMQDLRFTARTGKHSPKLFQECASGKRFQSATLTCQQAGQKPFEFLRIRINEVLVSGYQTGTPTSAGPGAQVGFDPYPVDQVSLNFGRIKVEVNRLAPDGKPTGWVSGVWDLKSNMAK